MIVTKASKEPRQEHLRLLPHRAIHLLTSDSIKGGGRHNCQAFTRLPHRISHFFLG